MFSKQQIDFKLKKRKRKIVLNLFLSQYKRKAYSDYNYYGDCCTDYV